MSDLINRDALREAIRKRLGISSLKYLTEQEKVIVEEIDNAPAVDISGNEYFPYRTAYFNGVVDGRATTRSPGEWIIKSNGTTNYYACNKCGSAGDIQDNFCRECGAKMQKGGAVDDT